MEQTADLRISLFRPYRGDAWPQGVQEDDDFHWRWDVPHRPAGADDLDDDGPADPGEPARIVDGGHTDGRASRADPRRAAGRATSSGGSRPRRAP